VKVLCILIILFFCFSSIVPSALGEGDWLDSDKIAHAGVSFGISLVSYNVYKKTTEMNTLQAKIAAFATSVLAGVAKELIDGDFDSKDLAAGAAGGALGAAVAIEF